uniref:MNAT1 component of CDK activating kinase n=1 Tax=Laticauda laticaudata TaxID=8630 RepID=A0A8C5RT45_LATLA
MKAHFCLKTKTNKEHIKSLVGVNWFFSFSCESCVELLFVRGSGNCQECDTPLRKSNFRVQLFEDPAVDKEVEIRKKVLKIYNKREDDFPNLAEYNDFLEEVEEIVFNLTNNVDVEDTRKKMEIYQKENKDVIHKNKIKLSREQEELEEALEVERQENEQRRLLIQKEEQMQQMLKRKNKQELLDKLVSKKRQPSFISKLAGLVDNLTAESIFGKIIHQSVKARSHWPTDAKRMHKGHSAQAKFRVRPSVVHRLQKW